MSPLGAFLAVRFAKGPLSFVFMSQETNIRESRKNHDIEMKRPDSRNGVDLMFEEFYKNPFPPKFITRARHFTGELERAQEADLCKGRVHLSTPLLNGLVH